MDESILKEIADLKAKIASMEGSKKETHADAFKIPAFKLKFKGEGKDLLDLDPEELQRGINEHMEQAMKATIEHLEKNQLKAAANEQKPKSDLEKVMEKFDIFNSQDVDLRELAALKMGRAAKECKTPEELEAKAAELAKALSRLAIKDEVKETESDKAVSQQASSADLAHMNPETPKTMEECKKHAKSVFDFWCKTNKNTA